MQDRALNWFVSVFCALTVGCVGGGREEMHNRLPPAFEAAMRDDTHKLRVLLADGVSVNSQDEEYGATLLMWAFRFGSTNVVSNLIEAGADVNLRDKTHNTALMYCARLGDYGVTASSNLVALGASVNVTNSNGQTPFSRAVASSNKPLIRFLIARGAMPDVQLAPLSETIVMLAAWRSDVDTLELMCALTQYSSDARDLRARNPVFYALDAVSFARDDTPRFQKKLDVLIRHGYEVNVTNRDGQTPLIVASKRCDFEAVKVLVSCGADPAARDLSNKTALDWAIENQCSSIEDYLRQLKRVGEDHSIKGSP